MCGAQGLESRRPLRAGVGVERAYAAVRALVPALLEDRVLGPDIERLAVAIGEGRFGVRP